MSWTGVKGVEAAKSGHFAVMTPVLTVISIIIREILQQSRMLSEDLRL
jgi:hypothetical protein